MLQYQPRETLVLKAQPSGPLPCMQYLIPKRHGVSRPAISHICHLYRFGEALGIGRAATGDQPPRGTCRELGCGALVHRAMRGAVPTHLRTRRWLSGRWFFSCVGRGKAGST